MADFKRLFIYKSAYIGNRYTSKGCTIAGATFAISVKHSFIGWE